MTDARDRFEDDLLAAELAFDLLDGADRVAASRRETEDGAFATLVDRWRARATGLLAGEDVTPPVWLWRSIAASLPANDTGEVRRWRVATGVAAAAALVLGVVALRPAAPPRVVATPRAAPVTPLVAMLAGPKSRAMVSVVVDRATKRLLVAAHGLRIPGRSAELWVIADGTPRALGLLDPAEQRRLSLPPGVAATLTPGATLAVSVEPVGGSPTDKPTGPVILTGQIGPA